MTLVILEDSIYQIMYNISLYVVSTAPLQEILSNENFVTMNEKSIEIAKQATYAIVKSTKC